MAESAHSAASALPDAYRLFIAGAPALQATAVQVSSEIVTDAAVPPRDAATASAGAAAATEGHAQHAAAGHADVHEGDGSDEEEAEGPGEDMQAVLWNLLQRKMPGARISCHALGMLEGLLDEIVQKVLTEAAASTSRDGSTPAEPLTSLAIQQAVKKLLPAGPLRPSLPAEVKKCVHLDRQSLRGIKRRRGGAAAAAPDADGTGSAAAVAEGAVAAAAAAEAGRADAAVATHAEATAGLVVQAGGMTALAADEAAAATCVLATDQAHTATAGT